MPVAPRRSPLALALVLVLAAGCGEERPRGSGPGPDTTAAVAPSPVPAPTAPSYRAVALTGDADLRALRDSLGERGFATLLAVNRIDLAHARAGDTLVVPAPADSFDAFSPFPTKIAGLDSCPKLLLVSNRVQAWAAYSAGVRVRWGACCTGRKTKPTPAGLYHTNWKQPERHSTIDGSWLLRWYVNLHSTEGVSFHVYELPGRPASHSCVRLSEVDARWIYDWCETWTLADRRHVAREGTPTLVLDAYAFGQRRPWHALVDDPLACDVPDSTIVGALRAAGLLRDAVANADSGETRPPDGTSAASSRRDTAGLAATH